MEDRVVAILVENSPAWSGPFYHMAAENWDIVQQLAIGILGFIVVCMLALAINFWSVWKD